jgi:hypothetical protein
MGEQNSERRQVANLDPDGGEVPAWLRGAPVFAAQQEDGTYRLSVETVRTRFELEALGLLPENSA